jgi:hypothetical protein
MQKTLQQVTKKQVPRRENKQAQKEPKGMRIQYRTMVHRRIPQKSTVLRKVRQEQLQMAMKILLVPKKPVVKVLRKAVKLFVKNEVPKKPMLKRKKG